MIDDFDWDSPYLEGNFYWRQAFEELERLANGGIDELISDFSNVLENLSKYKIHKNQKLILSRFKRVLGLSYTNYH